jgi:uncharacterized membrane protein YgcG
MLQVLNVGSFATELEAARAWNAAAVHFRGFDTLLNSVEPLLPEDEGVAVVAKLPQPPWGSLLLGQQHNQQLLQISQAIGCDAREEQHQGQEVSDNTTSEDRMVQPLRPNSGGGGGSSSGGSGGSGGGGSGGGGGGGGADGYRSNSSKRRELSRQQQTVPLKRSCRLSHR